MAMPTVIAVNQTAGNLLLTRTGLTVPASSTLTLTDYVSREEIWNDESLYAFVVAGDIKLDLGQGELSTGDSLRYWNLVPFQPITYSVRALATTNQTLSGDGILVDGVTLNDGDRILLTGQSTNTENGIWVVKTGAWLRPDDFSDGEAVGGTLVTMEGEGTVYKNQIWTCESATGSDVVGVDGLSFAQSAGSSGVTLQTSYENGNTITTSAGEGDITFTGTENLVLTLDTIDANVTGTIDLDATGNISIGAAADTGAINVGTGASARVITVGNATGATAVNVDTGTGGFDVDSLGVVSIGSTDTTDLTMAANSGVNKTLSILASNAGAGDGLIDIQADGAVSISSTASTIDLQASGNLTIDSSGGNIGIGTDANTGDINIGTAAAARDISIGNNTGATSVTVTAGTGNITLDAPLTTITGDLVVEGTTTSIKTQTVLVDDNHLYINNGYTTAVAQTGGLVVNYLPIATADTVGVGGFTAGVPATSNPTVETTGSGTFAVGQFIQVSGAANVENDGLYEVLSHVGTTLTIRGVGLTATVEDFTQNDFTTDTTATGAITRVTVSVMRAGTDGVWETGSGAVTPITFYDVTNTGTLSLQSAYDGGNTITTSGNTPIAFTLTSGDFTVDGPDIVDFGGTTPIGAFNVDTTGAVTVDGAGVSIDGTAASNFSVTGANLTLSTITSGNISIASAGTWSATGTTMDVDATGILSLNSSGGAINIGNDANAFAINMGTGAAARDITIGNGTGATGVLIQTGTEGFQVNSLGTGITTYYGKSSANPTARGGGFQDGDTYFNTSLKMEMIYDASRSKWLSTNTTTFYFGRNGNTPAATYYRGSSDGLVMSSTSGFRANHNGTIVELGYTRSDSDSATFDVVEGGVSRATLASTATSGGSTSLDGNFSSGGILAVLNQSGGNVTSDVSGYVVIRFRA